MKRLGTLLMALGVLCIAAAAVLLVGNQQEDRHAGIQSASIASQLQAYHPTAPSDPEAQIPSTLPDPYNPSMTEVEIDGHAYIGYLELPGWESALPVMSSWDYAKLRIAPCRYHGSTKTDDLVIMAHNYIRHFGPLDKLEPGAVISFTDMDGVTIRYEVVALEILYPTATEDMTSGQYDLTLFTCTYGGRSRVTLRCDRI